MMTCSKRFLHEFSLRRLSLRDDHSNVHRCVVGLVLVSVVKGDWHLARALLAITAGYYVLRWVVVILLRRQ